MMRPSSAEREKIWATDDRAKRFAGGGRGLVIIQGYAREHALLDIVRERLEREGLKRECLQGGANRRRHWWVLRAIAKLLTWALS